MSNDHGRQHDKRTDESLSSFFFFPCYSGDDGSRPAPSFVCSWLSPAILINGAPHDGKMLSPNQAIELSAVVTNNGSLGDAAFVSILYAPMSAQFTADLEIAVQFSDFWAAGETKAVGPKEWIVPAGLPSHICLLAAVDSLLDPIPTPLPQSIADRHYAQCNLDFMEVSPGATVSVPIALGQGAAPAQRMLARVRADFSVGAVALARSQLLHLDAELARQARPLLESVGLRQGSTELEFDSRQGDHEARLTVQMPEGARPGQAMILTIEQFAKTEADDTPALVGSLGVMLVAR